MNQAQEENNLRYAELRQNYDKLCSLCAPDNLENWKPNDEQKKLYADLLSSILNVADTVTTQHISDIFSSGKTVHYSPDNLLEFYRNEIEPNLPKLSELLKEFDPSSHELYGLLRGLFAPKGAQGRIRKTFDVAIDRMDEFLEHNPQFDGVFLSHAAREFIDSKLIDFDPDAWLNRAGELPPIRTKNKNFELPSNIRLRLIEIYRSYVFGNWLSILALARIIMEYAILDNLNKFNISKTWKNDRNEASDKSLKELIDDFSDFIPDYTDKMHRIRQTGNEYIHPTKENKNTPMFMRETAAKQVIVDLIDVVESLYIYKKI